MKPLLEIKNLTKIFQERRGFECVAAEQVNFVLYPNESLGIVGESGSGKSTLARLITGLIEPTSGQIFLSGQDIATMKGREKKKLYRKIQMVFQSPSGSFDPRRTLGFGIGEVLKNNGIPRREIKKEICKLLNQCGLEESFVDKYPREVSGGQCQRAAIARALAIHPQILICDEATSALDVTVQKQIMELLWNLKRQYRMSFLFICHDLALVQSFCDRVIVMKEGKIAEEGVTDQVIRHPQSAYTKRLISSVL